MALFTDYAVITIDDLLEFETSLVQVSSTHGIDVDTKINLATSAISDKLMLWLLNIGASDPQFINRRQLGLSTVVVTPPLQRWLCFESLSRFFAEAYNVQLNTRYQGKWTEYQKEAKNAADLSFMAGLGIVMAALPKAAEPLVSVQSGNSPAQQIFVQTAWVDVHGAEGALSDANGQKLPADSSIAVAMAEGALDAPAAAAGWNVYCGAQPSGLTRQNSSPLAIGSTWQLSPSGLVAGAAPIDGQKPSFYVALSRQILRG
ncbi:MAG TPA: hypothetical protein VHZ55_00290 [Bryobacteraceae bacterium]|jgi:hypothetical protein|nr:hypothetical protein [Bryobacteraceae bacterium]